MVNLRHIGKKSRIKQFRKHKKREKGCPLREIAIMPLLRLSV